MQNSKIIAQTISKIINNEYVADDVRGKGIICLKGFTENIFSELNNVFKNVNQFDVIWVSSESEGIELIKFRNDSTDTKIKIVFLDQYFSIAQSLEHFPKIIDVDLLYKNKYLKYLNTTAFNTNKKLDTELLFEAFEIIINEINPSLIKFVDFLIEVGKGTGIDSVGNSLWKLSLFKNEKLIADHAYKKASSQKQKTNKNLKKSFRKAITNNIYYSGPSANTLLTIKAISNSENLNSNERKLLFEYLQKGHSEILYKSIDFDTILSINKQRRIPKAINSKKTNKPERPFKDILFGIASVVQSYGRYNCICTSRLDHQGDEKVKEVEIEVEEIGASINYFKSQKTFTALYKSWKEVCVEDSEKIVFDIQDHKSFDVEIGSDRISANLIFDDIKVLSNEIKSKELMEFKELISDFLVNLKSVISTLNASYSLTLHLDVEQYFFSYSNVLFYLLENARSLNSYNEELYYKILSYFVQFGLKENSKNSSLEVSSYHPFKILTKRIDEICILELIGYNNKTIETTLNQDEHESIINISERFNEFKLKIWPKFLPNIQQRDESIYVRDIVNNEIVYKKSRIDRGGIVEPLLKQIENYVGNNRLSKLSLNLRVINPLDGEEIYKTMKKLYQTSEEAKPEHVRIFALGPDEKNTFSKFDDTSIDSAENLEEIFLIKTGSIYPFCLYYKNSIKVSYNDDEPEGWINDYIDNGDKFDADITAIIDPYNKSCIPKTKTLNDQAVSDINRMINNNSEDGFIQKILEDYTTFNDIFDTLSIRNLIKAIDYKNYKVEIQTERYKELIQKHQKNDEWCMLFDRYLDDYSAEKISESLKDRSVLSTVAGSNNGTTYVFTYPSKESLGVDEVAKNLIKIDPQERNELASWLFAQYGGRLARKEWFCNFFLRSQRQFIIPLAMFNSSEMKGLFIVENNNINNENIINIDEYLVILSFDMNNNYGYDLSYEIKYLHEDLFENNSEYLQIDMTFLNSNDSFVKNIKKQRFVGLLSTFLHNPFQSWFLAALNAGKVSYRSVDRSGPIYDNNIKLVLPFNLWRLRELINIIADGYNPSVKKYEGLKKLKTKSFLDKLEESYPYFYKRLIQWQSFRKLLNGA